MVLGAKASPQCAARLLITSWLLASVSPGGALNFSEPLEAHPASSGPNTNLTKLPGLPGDCVVTNDWLVTLDLDGLAEQQEPQEGICYPDANFLPPSAADSLPLSLVGALLDVLDGKYPENLSAVSKDRSSLSLRRVVSTNEEQEKEFNLKVHWEVETYQSWLAKLNRRTKDTVFSELAEQLEGPPLVGSAPGEDRQRHGPDGSRVAAVFKALEDAKATRKDPEGKRLFEHILAIFEQCYKRTPSLLDMADTLNDLGMDWSNLRDWRGTLIFFEYALAMYKQVYQETPNHPDVAQAWNNLGMTWHALGDTHKAVSFLKHALSIYEQVYDENVWHPDMAMALHNLGMAYSELDDLIRAKGYLERARAIYEQGDEAMRIHPAIAKNLNDLGTIYHALRNKHKAVSFLKHALSIYEQVYDENVWHPDMAMALHNLGMAYSELDDLIRAKGYLERARAIYEQGDEAMRIHSAIAKNLNDLGTIYHDLGNMDEAMSCLKNALAIYEELCHEMPSCPEQVNTLKNLATLYQELDNLREARSYLERA